MRADWWPQPREHLAEAYRRAHEQWDRERIGRYERAGFGFGDGYRGAYAERPAYAAPRGRLKPPEPEGSGWPHRHWTLTAEARARHLRALADRDIAHSVGAALYNAIGPGADRISVYATGGRVVLVGRVHTPRALRAAPAVAREVPGVRAVRSALRLRRY